MNLAVLIEDSLPSPLTEVALQLGARTVRSRQESFEAILCSPSSSGTRPSDAQIRENVRSTPVWLVPEAALGSDAVYGLIPLDEEFPDRLRAVWPLRISPAVQELKLLLRGDGFGQTLHLQLERVIVAGAGLALEQIESAWLHDADLLRYLCGGEYRQVTAIHSGITDQGISTASVSLAGEGVPDAMWALRTGPVARCELAVSTVSGAAVLAWGESGPPSLTVNCKEVSLSSRLRQNSDASRDPTASEIPLTPHSGKRGEPNKSSLPEGVTPWSEAVRAFDLLDAARRSLRRRRTVELQFESTSERSQFKTHMTTMGCGLLLFTMFGLIGLLFAGRMLDPRDAQQKQSEVAGFVLRESDFDSSGLNHFGKERLAEIIEAYSRRSATVLVEGVSEADSQSLQHREAVVQALAAAGFADAETRTQLRPLQGDWFKRFLTAAWVLLFLPLGIFLGFQFLLTVTPEDRAPGRRSP